MMLVCETRYSSSKHAATQTEVQLYPVTKAGTSTTIVLVSTHVRMETFLQHLVDKEVVSAGVWGDEAEPLGGVEPDSATRFKTSAAHVRRVLCVTPTRCAEQLDKV